MALEGDTLATARIKVVADARSLPEDVSKQAQKGLADEGTKAGSAFGKRMVLAIGAALAVGAAVVGKKLVSGLKESVAAASDLTEVTSKVGVVFGKGAKDIEKFASTAAKSLGQSKTETLNAAATFAIYGKGARLTGRDLIGFSKRLVTLSSDMASFSNTKPEEAVEAIGAALRGEFDPIERYGVLLSETTVKNQALKMGLISTTTQALTPQQRVLAVQAEILRQTSDAQGDFARTSQNLANQQRIASASVENLKAKIGTSLLPTVTKLTQVFNSQVIPAMNKLWEKHGPAVARVIETIGTQVGIFVEQLASGDFDSKFEGLKKTFDDLKASAGPALRDLLANVRPAAASVKNDLIPALKEAQKSGGKALSDTINVAAVAMAFLAGHIDTLAKALPYLVTALAAYKVAQLGANIAMAASPVIRLLEIQATRKQTLAIVANTAARSAESVVTGTGTAVVGANTAAQNVGTLARIRGTAATVAATAAGVVANTAMKIWTVTVKLFSLAMKGSLGPIGIIITVIAALVAGIIYAYKHNETFRKIVDQVWKAVKVVINATVQWFVAVVWPLLKRYIDFLIGYFKFLWEVVKVVWQGLKTAIQAQATIIIAIFNRIKTFITETIPNAFKSGVAAIGRIWSGLQELARKPIVFVVGVINKLIGGYNKIASVFHAPTAPTIPGFEDGGRIPGPPSDTDNMFAEGPGKRLMKVATGEYIVNARQTAKNLPLLQAINSAKGFAVGGLVGGVLDFFKNPLDYIKKLAAGFGDITNRFGNSGLAQTLVGMGKALVKSVGDKAKNVFGSGGVGGGGSFGAWPSSPSAQRGDSGVWRAVVALIRSTGPLSGSFGNAYRPGDPLWHGSGRAVDWMGFNQDALATFLSTRRPLELIHRTSRRDYAYTRGRNKGSFNNSLMQAHRNHIHIAMAHGGYMGGYGNGYLRRFDSGGAWPTGTVGVNTSGHTEHVLTGGANGDIGELIDLLRAMLAVMQGMGGDVAAALNSNTRKAIQIGRGRGTAVGVA